MDPLLQAALDARHRAYAPFSNFHVGAAIETADGRVFTGCNIENSSYGLTVCAERVALFSAIAAGARVFTRLAVAADTPTLTPPCGACRQVLYEFAQDLPITLVNPRGQTATHSIADLLPHAFHAGFLT